MIAKWMDNDLKLFCFKERSTLIATYALCGFASIVTVGLGLGSLGALAPRRISDFSKVAPWAVVSGTIASYQTACVAGTFCCYISCYFYYCYYYFLLLLL